MNWINWLTINPLELVKVFYIIRSRCQLRLIYDVFGWSVRAQNTSRPIDDWCNSMVWQIWYAWRPYPWLIPSNSVGGGKNRQIDDAVPDVLQDLIWCSVIFTFWVYLLNLKCARIVRRPESHLLIHLPYFYHLNSKNLQYSILMEALPLVDYAVEQSYWSHNGGCRVGGRIQLVMKEC